MQVNNVIGRENDHCPEISWNILKHFKCPGASWNISYLGANCGSQC